MMTIKQVESSSKANAERLHALADALDAAGRDDLGDALARVQDSANALKARHRLATAMALAAVQDAFAGLEDAGAGLLALMGVARPLTPGEAEAVALYPATPPQLPAPPSEGEVRQAAEMARGTPEPVEPEVGPADAGEVIDLSERAEALEREPHHGPTDERPDVGNAITNHAATLNGRHEQPAQPPARPRKRRRN